MRLALLPLALLATSWPARGRAEEPLVFTVRPSGVEGRETLDEKLARRERSVRYICIGCVRGAGEPVTAPFEPLRSLRVPDLAQALRVGDTEPAAPVAEPAP